MNDNYIRFGSLENEEDRNDFIRIYQSYNGENTFPSKDAVLVADMEYIIDSVDDVIHYNMRKLYITPALICFMINSYLVDVGSNMKLYLDLENHELLLLDPTLVTLDDFSTEDDFRISKLKETSEPAIFRKETMINLVADKLKDHYLFSEELHRALGIDFSMYSRGHLFAVMGERRNLRNITDKEIDRFAKIIYDIEMSDNRPFKEVANEVLDNIETYGVEKALIEME